MNRWKERVTTYQKKNSGTSHPIPQTAKPSVFLLIQSNKRSGTRLKTESETGVATRIENNTCHRNKRFGIVKSQYFKQPSCALHAAFLEIAWYW